MPRELSSDTKRIYWWAWRWPWASAKDIARVTGLNPRAVSNALTRGREERRGWLLSARLGRTSQAADRYVFTNKGIEEMGIQFGWEPFWWHTAEAVRALARRLEIVELAYAYLPGFWQSNAVSSPKCYVFWEWEDTAWQTGETIIRPEMIETDWSNAVLLGFCWLQNGGPFEAVASYYNGNRDHGLVHIPIMWRGSFQGPDDISGVLQDMEKVLVEDKRWGETAFNPGYRWPLPWGHCFLHGPRRRSGAAAKLVGEQRERNKSSAARATLAIIDAQGQVVHTMLPPASRWSALRPPPPHVGELKDIKSAVDSLGKRAYPTVNGKAGLAGLPLGRRLSRGDPGADIGIHGGG